MARKCVALRRDGGRCNGTATTGSAWCPSHDPERAEDRRQAARKAALAKHAPDELTALKTRLKALMGDLEDGTIDARTGATMVQTSRALLATIQAENEMTTIAAVEKRLERISELERASRKWAN